MGKRTRRAGARAEKSADLHKEDRQFVTLQSSRREKCESFKKDGTLQRERNRVCLSSCFLQGNLTASHEIRREVFSCTKVVSEVKCVA